MNFKRTLDILARIPGVSGCVAFARRKYISHQERTYFLRLAKESFEQEKPTVASWDDYYADFKKRGVEYSEYFHKYHFYALSEEEKWEFVTRSELRKYYSKHLPRDVRHMFQFKQIFLKSFKEYIKREFFVAREARLEDFEKLLSEGDLIVKPLASSWGIGVSKIAQGSVTDVKELFTELQRKNYLVEQCVDGCAGLQSFHPLSLNTLRVMTISNGKEGEVMASFFRTGTGASVVDNAHNGGLFATIDIETGTIVTDGIADSGEAFETHPDTGVRFKGFVIPQWEEIKKTCVSASLKYKDVRFVGWDVAINSRGEVDFIEGNATPDADVLNAVFNQRFRRRFRELTTKYFGEKEAIA